MQDHQSSLTALISAFGRAYHSRFDSPHIFDDSMAHRLFREGEFALLGRNMAAALPFFAPQYADQQLNQEEALAIVMRNQSTPITLSRAKYTEDSLHAALADGVQQYVILGAGFDTYAFRKPPTAQLHVFEVDHPATQQDKRERIAAFSPELPDCLHFVPVDFTRERLVEKLLASPFSPNQRSFFSWLGVTYYLPQDVVQDTLRAIAQLAPSGSTILFDYLDPAAFDPAIAAPRVQKMLQVVARTGEPMITGFDPQTLAALLADLGWKLEENLAPADIQARFFQGQTHGYSAFEHVHFARAVVR
ncbi:class I SAM-dependent methyltransferase [Brevibacillus fluminis]|uniref:class I SAM-dependent methyltransferase n=1 Tax=Brevibacillus fluminis TaxID=511487 RepID=UPI003F8AFEA9